MKLIVGLGNPGPGYLKNRHNIGFMAVDRIAREHGFPAWRSRFHGLMSEGRLGAERVALLKPQTFMNLSGQSVGEAARYLGVDPADVIVLHDELDLPPGRLRLKTGGGHAGHNGLRSIHQHLGEGYRRLRIGIGHPGARERVVGHVLSDFSRDEQPMIEALLDAVAAAAPALAAGDEAGFQRALAAALPPEVRAAPAPAPQPRRAPKPVASQQSPPPAQPEDPPGPAERLRRLAERFR